MIPLWGIPVGIVRPATSWRGSGIGRLNVMILFRSKVAMDNSLCFA
jgi:hypothetical protein